MVDTTGIVDGNRARTGGLTARVEPAAKGMESYRHFAGVSNPAPPQSAAWVDAWLGQPGTDGLIATVDQAGSPILMVALEVRARGPFRVAEWPGGSHANGNFAPWTGDSRHQKPVLDALMGAIRTARRDIDLVLLERQLREKDGAANPFEAASLQGTSPNIALAADLTGGFDAVLDRNSRKRKLKKHRSQTRKFEAAGGFRRFEASDEAEVRRLLDAFFTMKAERFRRQGIADVFAASAVRNAFAGLYIDALQFSPRPFALHALEVGGVVRAVTGSARSGERVVCDFVAYGDDDLAAASPGDFLAFENIRAACEEGYAIFDFSVGDETYKRAWCDIETRQFDAFLPLTVKGHALALAELGLAGAKRRIKESTTLWTLTKRVRALRGGRSADRESLSGED